MNSLSWGVRNKKNKKSIYKPIISITNKKARKTDAVPAGKQENALLHKNTMIKTNTSTYTKGTVQNAKKAISVFFH